MTRGTKNTDHCSKETLGILKALERALCGASTDKWINIVKT